LGLVELVDLVEFDLVDLVELVEFDLVEIVDLTFDMNYNVL